MVAIRAVRHVLAAVFALLLALASTAEAKKEVPQVLCESCRATLTELRADVTISNNHLPNAVSFQNRFSLLSSVLSCRVRAGGDG